MTSLDANSYVSITLTSLPTWWDSFTSSVGNSFGASTVSCDTEGTLVEVLEYTQTGDGCPAGYKATISSDALTTTLTCTVVSPTSVAWTIPCYMTTTADVAYVDGGTVTSSDQPATTNVDGTTYTTATQTFTEFVKSTITTTELAKLKARSTSVHTLRKRDGSKLSSRFSRKIENNESIIPLELRDSCTVDCSGGQSCT
jgi:hypothetical protein